MSTSAKSQIYPNGKVFAHFDKLVAPVLAFANGKTFKFVEEAQFRAGKSDDVPGVLHLYWSEIFARAQWGALVALKRHSRWHAACLRLGIHEPNYLGFAATLRALIESAADISHGLIKVPTTLATHHARIASILKEEPGTEGLIIKDLEDSLIHFLYARKPSKQEVARQSHTALPMSEYFAAAQGSGPPLLQKLYAELCQIAHPAAYSTMAFVDSPDGVTITITDGRDGNQIAELCCEHREAIEYAFFQAVNLPLITLKTLNLFPAEKFHTPYLNEVTFDGVTAWRNIVKLMGSSS